MKNEGVFFGGIPTDIDIEKITERFGVPEKGTLISYSDIEETIGYRKSQSRFHSVVSAWRKRLLRDHNLVTNGIRNEGIKILDESDRVEHVGTKTKTSARALERAHKIAATTDRSDLAPHEIRRLDHLSTLTSAVIQSMHRMTIDFREEVKRLKGKD